jgi:hypothetical protein
VSSRPHPDDSLLSWRWARLVMGALELVPDTSDVAVALALASHVDESNGQGWPSLATLARETRLHRRTVLRSVQRLEGAGLLVVRRRPGRVNLYTVVTGGMRPRAA